ncbi:MAG: hypothetical protein ACLT33_06200 [Lachnospira pectinoschiza]
MRDKGSNTIAKIAKSHNCIIIETDYDTYTVARLMNQAIPVGFFMTQETELYVLRQPIMLKIFRKL